MRILERILCRFIHIPDSEKDAYLAAMNDIHAYQKSMITYRVVGLHKDDFNIIEDNYTGLSKKEAKAQFNADHPGCFTTYIKAFGSDEAERYYYHMNQLEAMTKRLKGKNYRCIK